MWLFNQYDKMFSNMKRSEKGFSLKCVYKQRMNF